MTDGRLASAQPARRYLARIAALAFVLLAAWEVAVVMRAGASVPTDADWQAVAAAIPRTLGSEQVIVFAPDWIDPVGRKWLGDRLSIDQVARMDLTRFRDVWEVSSRGASARELAGMAIADDRAYGALRLRHVHRQAPDVVWAPSEDRQICEVDFAPRRGVVLDLHHELAQSVRTFAGVTLGSAFQVYAGLNDYKKRSVNQSGALLQVMVDGQLVGQALLRNASGWLPLSLVQTTPGPHTVEFVARVQAPRGAVDLSVCVAAESWGAVR